MFVQIKINIDEYDMFTLEDLVKNQAISVDDVMQSRAFKLLNPKQKLYCKKRLLKLADLDCDFQDVA